MDNMLDEITILIAEDELITSEILESMLRQWGYTVIKATDGNEAWQILQQDNPPNLLLLDWMMPGMTGLEICQNIRRQSNKSYIYTILLTSKTESEDVIKGLDAGADDYITKPFDSQELKARIKAGLRILGLETNLMKLMERLREGEHFRRQFISELTFDLRAPLLATQKSLKLFQVCKNELDSRMAEVVDTLVRNNEESLTIINQLLASSQGDVELSPRLTNLARSLAQSNEESLMLVSNILESHFGGKYDEQLSL